MKKRILACLLALVMLIGVLPVMALAEDSYAAVRFVHDEKAKIDSTGNVYNTLDEAMEHAASVDTIYLGKGTYCGNAAKPTEKRHGSGEKSDLCGRRYRRNNVADLAPEEPYGSDGYCDYSFKGSDSITFRI